ncbi:MAG: hypothetical protein AABX19_04410 [Nanoarchaeota archaeon]
MNIKILEEIESKLLGIKRLVLEVDHASNATPKREDIKNQIAKKYSVEANLVAVRNIFTNFGMNTSKVLVNIYNSEKDLKFLEPPKGKKVEPKKAA